ncbi:hypothetical protein HMPREF1248_0253 [Coriobacteriaceae bacterium BV3Ac1]|nr:hypothetical protein HMPREF1248_0253 [Coriobacteriaceae bacterium BV3Ac1]
MNSKLPIRKRRFHKFAAEISKMVVYRMLCCVSFVCEVPYYPTV